MSDTEAEIKVNIDTSSALASIKLLQRQISEFQQAMQRAGAANAASAAQLQQNLINNINSSGKFSASIQKIKSSTESFTEALEKNKMSMGEYFRYAGASTKSFGKLFKQEFDTIETVARERVKTIQTQYISLGRDANGALRAIKVRPLALDMDSLATKSAIAAQKQQLLNQMLKQGSTALLNFGKNTQWAGRQLMVGFTIPLVMMGSAASKAYMQIEAASVKFKRVYGDMQTTTEEANKMAKSVQNLASEFTKYGVAVADTMQMAADAAAMGKTGADLLAQVQEAAKLSVLGGVDQAKALETTISLTNTFNVATQDLGKSIDFLNAVENQTVLSIDDMTTAIPKAAPVVQQLGGDVKDLAFFLTAMKEGGINASEGANALKSGLASMINPTKKASDFLMSFGINAKAIVEKDKGNVKQTVVDMAAAFDTLDPLNRARAIEQMFGKFQFARISTLFKNVIDQGSQANRVAGLAKQTAAELAILSEREMKKVSDSPMFKFQKAMQDFQAKLAPVGEAFLKAITPLVEFVGKILDGFNNLSAGTKQMISVITIAVAGIGPVVLMAFGLLANGVANLIKLFATLKGFFNKNASASATLGEQTKYMTQAQLEAASVAASLEQSHNRLTQAFSSEKAAITQLTDAYKRAVQAQQAFAGVPGVPVGNVNAKPKKYANGVSMVPGPAGAGDIVPALLSPGEAVIPAKHARKYAPVIAGMVAGNLPGFENGTTGVGQMTQSIYGPLTQKQTEGMARTGLELERISDEVWAGPYGSTKPTKYGMQISPSTGHSFPAFGVGGVYEKGDGTKVFVKPQMDLVSAMAEQRATQIARDAHGLISPKQEIRVMMDPTDPRGHRKFIVLESPVDDAISNITNKFTKEQYFKQHVAALLRGDKDLGIGNLGGNVLADVGTAGVFQRASGKRELGAKINSMEEQAIINLLGVKGGAKRFFAESTSELVSKMTPEQYDAAMKSEISKVIPKLQATIAGFQGLNPLEKAAYADMQRRLQAGLGVNWGQYQVLHSKVPPKKFAMGGVVPGYNGGTSKVPSQAVSWESMVADWVGGLGKTTNSSHLGPELDANDPEVRKQIAKVTKITDKQLKDFKIVGNLTADMPSWVNNSLRTDVGEGLPSQLFSRAWNSVHGKMVSTAKAAKLPTNLSGVVQKIEDGIGAKTAASASLIKDDILARSTIDYLTPLSQKTGDESIVANAFLQRAGLVGNIRSSFDAEGSAGMNNDQYIRQGIKDGKFVFHPSGYSILLAGNKNIRVAELRPAGSTKSAKGMQYMAERDRWLKQYPANREAFIDTLPRTLPLKASSGIRQLFNAKKTGHTGYEEVGPMYTGASDMDVFDKVKFLGKTGWQYNKKAKQWTQALKLAEGTANVSQSAVAAFGAHQPFTSAHESIARLGMELAAKQGVPFRQFSTMQGKSKRSILPDELKTKLIRESIGITPDLTRDPFTLMETLSAQGIKNLTLLLGQDRMGAGAFDLAAAKYGIKLDKVGIPRDPNGVSGTATRLAAGNKDWDAFFKLVAPSATQATKHEVFKQLQAGVNVKKYANGVFSVPGPKGAGDVVPAMLSPGEAVIPAKQADKHRGLIQQMIYGGLPGYKDSNVPPPKSKIPGVPDPEPYVPPTQSAASGFFEGLKATVATGIREGIQATKTVASNAVAKAKVVGENVGYNVVNTLLNPTNAPMADSKGVVRNQKQVDAIAAEKKAVEKQNRERATAARKYLEANDEEYTAAQKRTEQLQQKINDGKKLTKAELEEFKIQKQLMLDKRAAVREEIKQEQIANGTIVGPRPEKGTEEYKKMRIEEKAKLNSAIQNVTGKIANVGMTLTTVAGMASMIPGKMGEAAQSMLMPLSALTTVASFVRGPWTAAFAAIAATIGGVAMVINGLNDEFNKASDKIMGMKTALEGSTESIRKLSVFAKTVTAGEYMDKVRSKQTSLVVAAPGKTTFGESYVKSDQGKEMVSNINKQIVADKGSITKVIEQVSNQLSVAVASGAVTGDQASSIAANLGRAIGQPTFGLKVRAKVVQMTGPDGKDIGKNAVELAVKLSERSIARIKQDAKDLGETLEKERLWTGAKNNSTNRNINTGGMAALGAGVGAAGGYALTQRLIATEAVKGVAQLTAGMSRLQIVTSLAQVAGKSIAATMARVAMMAGPIGMLIGIGVSLAMAWADAVEKQKRAGEQAGVLVADMKIALQQQKEMSDALETYYSKKIAEAVAEGKIVEAKKLQLELDGKRDRLAKAHQAVAETILKTYEQSDNTMKEATTSAIDNAITTRYKDNADMQMYIPQVNQSLTTLKDSGSLTESQTRLLKIEMAAGDITPDNMNNLLNIMGSSNVQSTAAIKVLTEFGPGAATTFAQVSSMLQSKATQYTFALKIEDFTSSSEVLDFMEFTRNIAAMGGVIESDVYVRYYSEYENNADKQRLSAIFDNLDTQKVVTRDLAYKINPLLKETSIDTATKDKIVAFDEAYFKKLNNEADQEQYIKAASIILEVPFVRLQEDSAFIAWLDDEGDYGGLQYTKKYGNPISGESTLGPKGWVQLYAQSMAEKVTTETPASDSTIGGDGGGQKTGPNASWLDEVVKKTRDYTSIVQKLTVGWNASAKAIKDYINSAKGLKTTSLMGGLQQQFRAGGANEQLINYLSDAGNEKDIKKIFNKGSLTNFGKVVQRDMNFNTLGQTAGNFQQQIFGANNYTKALKILTKTGVDYKTATEMAKNEELAAALVQLNATETTKKSTKALKDKINALAKMSLYQEQLARGKMSAEELSISDAEVAIETMTAKQNLYQDMLSRIEMEEKKVNKQYDERVKALDTVAKLNDRIAQQEKGQLSLADALSRGDIAAAARAAQDLRAQDAQNAIQDQKDNLQKARDADLAAIAIEYNGQLFYRKDLETDIDKLSQQILDKKLAEIDSQKLLIAQRAEDHLALVKNFKVTKDIKDMLFKASKIKLPTVADVSGNGGTQTGTTQTGTTQTGETEDVPDVTVDNSAKIGALAKSMTTGFKAIQTQHGAAVKAAYGKLKINGKTYEKQSDVDAAVKNKTVTQAQANTWKANRAAYTTTYNKAHSYGVQWLGKPGTEIQYTNRDIYEAREGFQDMAAQLETLINKDTVAKKNLALVQNSWTNYSSDREDLRGATDMWRETRNKAGLDAGRDDGNYWTLKRIKAEKSGKMIRHPDDSSKMISVYDYVKDSGEYFGTVSQHIKDRYLETHDARQYFDDKGWMDALIGANLIKLDDAAQTPKKFVSPWKTNRYASGGFVSGYANGGAIYGTDTIPAMLTAGEYVIKKSAVDSIGVDNLNSINQSGAMSGESVYNYNITVNATGNLDANDVARKVMEQIKQVDSQRIRSNNY